MLSPSEHKHLENYIQDMDVSRLTVAFDALSEPNRCLIFRALLKNSRANVDQLASAIGISESLASQHLKILREAGLVTRRKEGKRVYYDMNSKDALVEALKNVVED
jgi:DNA-binding transcriptional ArsR family regulator